MSAIFLTSVFLTTIELAGAVNASGVAGAVIQNNPLSNSVNNGAAAAPTHWAADTTNGCKVWNPGEIASGVTARWSGRCENNFAQGPGTVRWLNDNKQMAELTGTMEQGKIRGHTVGVEEPGNRYDGMFIDSLPEGEGKANFSDGSVYSGMWHRGRQLGYGIMTFPPAHPQYQEMLNSGKGRRIENGTYEMRGWWEGKTFIFPCDSEEECEKILVAQIKREQEAAAAKAGTPVTPAPAAPVAPAVEPAATTPTPATIPAAGPVVTTPAIPAAEPVATTPATPAAEPAVAAPVTPPTEPAATTPKTELPVMESVSPALPEPANPVADQAPATPTSELPVPNPSAPGAPDVEPAPVPSATAPIPELPVVTPVVVPSTSAPAAPAAEPVGEPAAAPDDKPAVVPEAAPVT
ncbi:hypothetical protein [Collimonas sp. OK607]|uniref:hypothetical protein n=1 Tax=Collimonas sp. OK607 TaxID=1798194 RepID=UPI001479A72A|nr:hypothetical protein [Collimonas sp. OK607]